ncbi:nucleotidyl transferase AbiEii/AbiGii toxin family protein [Pandoraea apista]|uniref:nucleotidyl transferase AbiEii/AbiGii toxin family protein n=1 Tax=Pandoraea apista TaxID=93218 RepID=UPI000F65C2D5|nr:nucleotidyl transferase AbiEii/AbiGii toxin family protein [Pandoraea apista]RRW88474.1 nucleotidyl transferase AbiEii/AbiGii toxin family protein [Pandoraea apista]RRW96839.1 nucleotidyl transferase AbiEii/AbiGii toxin family protein [Pandoraea apista]
MNEIEAWVAATNVPEQTAFRRVVHIVLHAIASHHELRPQMVMKGGILAAVLYHTGRFTRDIDFSSPKHYREFQAGQDTFVRNLADAIALAGEELPYGLACRIQRQELRPGVEGNFQTLHIRVGYAQKSNASAMKRLAAGASAQVIDIDYSFNELVGDISTIDLGGNEPLEAYGQLTLMAEKFRALLQQADIAGGRARGSNRGQDIFDIHTLLINYPLSIHQQDHMLQLLIEKSASRHLDVSRNLMQRPEIRERCRDRYEALQNEIEGELIPFDQAFDAVKAFYEQLPWPKHRQ